MFRADFKGMKLSEQKVAVIAVDENTCREIFESKEHEERRARFFDYFKAATKNATVRFYVMPSSQKKGETESSNNAYLGDLQRYCQQQGWEVQPDMSVSGSSARNRMICFESILTHVGETYPNYQVDLYVSAENQAEPKIMREYIESKRTTLGQEVFFHFLRINPLVVGLSENNEMILEAATYRMDEPLAREIEKLVAVPEVTRKKSGDDKSPSCWAQLCCWMRKPAAIPENKPVSEAEAGLSSTAPASKHR